jgi:hypothetical protein
LDATFKGLEDEGASGDRCDVAGRLSQIMQRTPKVTLWASRGLFLDGSRQLRIEYSRIVLTKSQELTRALDTASQLY